MIFQDELFEGKLVYFAAIDHEKDPEIESGWTQDAAYLRMLDLGPARPLSPAMVKKKYEALEKEIEESKNIFYYPFHAKADDRLIGFARLDVAEWQHGIGSVSLGIGDRQDRRKGYGEEALRLLVRYGFTEINLFRLSAAIPEYNQAALSLFHKVGFVDEVHRRQAVQRDGRCWDLILLGLLRDEWQARQA